MSLGSIENARHVYESHFYQNGIPAGYDFVGQGSTRLALRGPDGVVYKVPRFRDDNEYNLIESAAARRWRKSKRLERLETVVPRTHLYRVDTHGGQPQYVIAMEYVKKAAEISCRFYVDEDEPEYSQSCSCRYWGQARICYAVLLDELEELGVPDMFEENLIYGTDNLFHIVDLGCE